MTEQLARRLSQTELAVLGEHVYCDDEIGFGWSVLDDMPAESALARINARNEALLRTLALVEEHDETQSDDAERAEMHRLEAKVDLALELLSELIAAGRTAAAPREVRFNSRGLCWQAADTPEVGQLLLVECYASLAWPLPLKLLARVSSSEAVGSEYRVCTRLEGLSPGAKNWLEKLVFRRHRRAVARRRANPKAVPAA